MSTIKIAQTIGDWLGRLVAWGFFALIVHAWFILHDQHLAVLWTIAMFGCAIWARLSEILTALRPKQAASPEDV